METEITLNAEATAIDQALDSRFRALMLDPAARLAMCQASRQGVRELWALRMAPELRVVIRFYLKVIRLGRRLAD